MGTNENLRSRIKAYCNYNFYIYIIGLDLQSYK